jgi:hypothetical protein
MARYYKRNCGLIAMDMYTNRTTDMVSYTACILDKYKREVEGSRITHDSVHSTFISDAEARVMRRVLVSSVEALAVFLPSCCIGAKARIPKVRFSRIIQEFDVERKPRCTKAQREAEWDAFGEVIRMKGLCVPDSMIE